MEPTEVKIKKVENGLLVIYMKPVIGRQGVGTYEETVYLIEETEKKKAKHQVANRLINFLSDYFKLTYYGDDVDGTDEK